MQARVRLVVDERRSRERADGLRPKALDRCCNGLLDARVAEQGRDARRLLLCRTALAERAEQAEDATAVGVGSHEYSQYLDAAVDEVIDRRNHALVA